MKKKKKEGKQQFLVIVIINLFRLISNVSMTFAFAILGYKQMLFLVYPLYSETLY